MRTILSVLMVSVGGGTGGSLSFVGWTIGWFLLNQISGATNQSSGFVVSNIVFFACPIGSPLLGSLCALTIALALRKASIPIGRKQRYVIIAGWALGFFASQTSGVLGMLIGSIIVMASGLTGYAILNFFGGVVGFGVGMIMGWMVALICIFIGSAVSGAIGSSVMFWQLGHASRPSVY